MLLVENLINHLCARQGHDSARTAATRPKSQSTGDDACNTRHDPRLPVEMSAVLSKPQLRGQGGSRRLTFGSQDQARAEGYAEEFQ